MDGMSARLHRTHDRHVPSPWGFPWTVLLLALAVVAPAAAHDIVPKFTLSGTVTSAESGEPVAGARVDLLEPRFPPLVIAQATTDTDGAYRFDIVLEGLYYVAVSEASGFLPEVYDGFLCVLDECDYFEGRAVEVSQDVPNPGGIDFSLERPATLSGTVIDVLTREPVGGVQIIVAMESPPTLEYRSIDTDSDGSWRTEVPPGRVWVVAADGGYQDLMYPNVPCGQVVVGVPDCLLLDELAIPTTVGGSQVLDFALDRGMSISGRVVEEGTGEPIAGTQVELRSEGEFIKFTETQADGTYVLGGLPAGTFFPSTRTPNEPFLDELLGGLPCYRLGFQPPDCDLLGGQSVTVQAGSQLTGVDFALARGARLTGRTVDKVTGEPLERIIEVFDGQGRRTDGMLTDEDGRFRSQGLPPGSYTVFTQSFNFPITHAGEAFDGVVCHPSCEPENVLARDDVTPVALQGAEVRDGVDFELLRLGRITGRITDAETGQGLANASVFLNVGVPLASGHVHTDADGSYEFEGAIDGSYKVDAFSDGYLRTTYPGVVAGPGELVEARIGATVSGIDIPLRAGGGIGVQVKQLGLAGALEAVATAYDLDGRPVFTRTVNETVQALAPLLPGDYYVQVERGGLKVTYPDLVCSGDCDPTLGGARHGRGPALYQHRCGIPFGRPGVRAERHELMPRRRPLRRAHRIPAARRGLYARRRRDAH
ncbi:MAG: carboxypeptidase-like regulatory domain-containing protein [Acidobacteriota bacterium]